jgi:hypothetical protein
MFADVGDKPGDGGASRAARGKKPFPVWREAFAQASTDA